MATNIQGNSAAAVADEGNPVKVGGKYVAAGVTVTDGHRHDLQLDSNGSLMVSLLAGSKGIGNDSASSDALSSAVNLSRVAARGFLYNGSTWDRMGKVVSTARLLSAAASTNATNVKNAAGNVFKIVGTNTNAAARYLKLYNKATAPTVGTDTPVWTFYLPPSTVNGGQFELNFGSMPLYFAAGIGYGLTTAAADADTGALTAGDVVAMNIGYS